MTPNTRANGLVGELQASTPAGPIAAPTALVPPAILPALLQALGNSPPQPGFQYVQFGHTPYLGLTQEQLDATFALK